MDDAILQRHAIRLDEHAASRDDAIRRCGGVLVEVGAVDPAYVEAMLDRERSISTYVGEGVAIPHGTLEGKSAVRRDALAVVRFRDLDGTANGDVCVEIADWRRHVDCWRVGRVPPREDRPRRCAEDTDTRRGV